MEINRNHYFLAGIVLLLLGVQYRMVDTVVLNSEATRFLAEQSNHPVVAASNGLEALLGTESRMATKAIKPPEWLGWVFASLGGVLILHSLAMPKAG